MQSKDGLNKTCHTHDRISWSSRELSELESGHGLLDQGSDLCVSPMDGLVSCRKGLPAGPVLDTDHSSGTPVSPINIDRVEIIDSWRDW